MSTLSSPDNIIMYPNKKKSKGNLVVMKENWSHVYVGDGINQEFIIEHSASQYPIVQVYDSETGLLVSPDVKIMPDSFTHRFMLIFDHVPEMGQYVVRIA